MADRKSRPKNSSTLGKIEFKNSAKDSFFDPADGKRPGNRFTLIANDVDIVLEPSVIGKLDDVSNDIVEFFDSLNRRPESFFAPGVYEKLDEQQRDRHLKYIDKRVAKHFAFFVSDHFVRNKSIAHYLRWIFSRKSHGEQKPKYDINILAPISTPNGQTKISAEKGDVGVEDLNYKELAAYVARLEAKEPEFVAALKDARAAKDLASEFDRVSAAIPKSAPDIPLWFDRKHGINAVQFIKANYGEKRGDTWDHCGVARADLKNNPGLYGAYTAWIRDHPEDKLDFASEGGKPVGRPRKPNADEDRRTRDRERKSKERQPAAPK